jgi:hypothetical protein
LCVCLCVCVCVCVCVCACVCVVVCVLVRLCVCARDVHVRLPSGSFEHTHDNCCVYTSGPGRKGVKGKRTLIANGNWI